VQGRGDGMHHTTFIVDDLPSEVARMRDAGYEVVGEDVSGPAWLEAFWGPAPPTAPSSSWPGPR
jgi:methylmalonyl-CoA/ethylmalonyl-CoA epimerase